MNNMVPPFNPFVMCNPNNQILWENRIIQLEKEIKELEKRISNLENQSKEINIEDKTDMYML